MIKTKARAVNKGAKMYTPSLIFVIIVPNNRVAVDNLTYLLFAVVGLVTRSYTRS